MELQVTYRISKYLKGSCKILQNRYKLFLAAVHWLGVACVRMLPLTVRAEYNKPYYNGTKGSFGHGVTSDLQNLKKS